MYVKLNNAVGQKNLRRQIVTIRNTRFMKNFLMELPKFNIFTFSGIFGFACSLSFHHRPVLVHQSIADAM